VPDDVHRVGIVGAGTMGAGIAQVALEAGHLVAIADQDPDALPAATARIRLGLTKRASKAGRTEAWVDGCLARLAPVSSLHEVAADADLVIEAAIEDLALKEAIFQTLAAASPGHAILATNTSALSVGAIAAATTCPERVVGLHFFNPAPVMQLVEVISTPATEPAVVATAMALMTAWGKTPVRCADSPGFIVNRVNRPFTIQALRMLDTGEAGVVEIDAALRDAGFPMGPFELMDLIGIDINLAAARGVWEGLGRPDRLRPSPTQESLVAAGRLGRKTGRGFYRYDEAGRTTGTALLPTGATPIPIPLTSTEIVARIRDAIDSEARLTEAEGVATAGDIDLALRLGAGHPSRTSGPNGDATIAP
jgi:3-hydroxybutyryl-CoA dehydrogenase